MAVTLCFSHNKREKSGWTDVARVVFGLIRIVSRDSLWTRVLAYEYARLCFMFSSLVLNFLA